MFGDLVKGGPRGILCNLCNGRRGGAEAGHKPGAEAGHKPAAAAARETEGQKMLAELPKLVQERITFELARP